MATETLDELLAEYQRNPPAWRRVLYFALAAKEEGQTVATTLGPMELPPAGELSEVAVWQGLARRMGAPGRAVVRLASAVGAPQMSVGVTLTDAMFETYRAAPAPAPAVATPGTHAYPTPPPVAPPTDILALSMKSQQDTMNTLLALIMKPREDPAIAVLLSEIKRLTDERKEPAKAEKAEREYLMELGKQLADKDTGFAAAIPLLQGPFDKLASAVEKLVEARADEIKSNAETRQLVAAIKARQAGVPTQDPDNVMDADTGTEQPMKGEGPAA